MKIHLLLVFAYAWFPLFSAAQQLPVDVRAERLMNKPILRPSSGEAAIPWYSLGILQPGSDHERWKNDSVISRPG